MSRREARGFAAGRGVMAKAASAPAAAMDADASGVAGPGGFTTNEFDSGGGQAGLEPSRACAVLAGYDQRSFA